MAGNVLKKLNIGSGMKPMKSTKEEEWINLDKDYFIGVDVMKDCSRGLPFDKNTFDYVLMSHVIEHLTGEEIESTFRDLFRVCKHNARIEIVTPYYLHPSSWGDFTHKQHLSEWLWEHMQAKSVIVPQSDKLFIMWRFNIEGIRVREGEMTCVYTVYKGKDYKPTKVDFSREKECAEDSAQANTKK